MYICLYVYTYLCLSYVYGAKDLIDPMEHEIFIVTGQNFDRTVSKFRTDHVASVLYYDDSPESKRLIDGIYNDIAKDLKGMVKVAALSCLEWPIFCKDNGIDTVPHIVVYPPNPMPSFKYDGEVTKKDVSNRLLSLIPDRHVSRLTAENVNEFLTKQVAIPKAILASEKNKIPVIWKAVANSFHDRLTFGFFTKEDAKLVDKFKVTKFPHVFLQKGDKPPQVYAGKVSFLQLHEWTNIHAETFVRGGGFADQNAPSEDAKPWLAETIPQVTDLSHQDICFKKKEGLCVIYLKEGNSLETSEESMLEGLKNKYTSNLSDRGTTFYWMWMDVNMEPNFKQLFDFEKYPSVVVFNPHKRLRFAKLDSSMTATEDTINSLLEKIIGGDARFVVVKGQKLPAFTKREAPADAKAKPKKDEL